MQEGFKQYVERPATLCIPVPAAFSLGNGAQIYRADFFDMPTDFWLNMYLAGSVWHPHIPAGIRHPRATGAAQRPAIAAHRERVPGRFERDRRLPHQGHHRIRQSAAGK